jgi:hypothetical protein
MKTTLLSILLLTSCTIARHPTAGLYASMGGDTKGLKMDASGISMDSNDNSSAFKDVMKQIKSMWTNYLMAKGLEYVSGLYYNHQGKVVGDATTVKLEELRNAKDLKLAELKLEELKIMPEPL